MKQSAHSLASLSWLFPGKQRLDLIESSCSHRKLATTERILCKASDALLKSASNPSNDLQRSGTTVEGLTILPSLSGCCFSYSRPHSIHLDTVPTGSPTFSSKLTAKDLISAASSTPVLDASSSSQLTFSSAPRTSSRRLGPSSNVQKGRRGTCEIAPLPCGPTDSPLGNHVDMQLLILPIGCRNTRGLRFRSKELIKFGLQCVRRFFAEFQLLFRLP